MIIHSIRTS
ncbi:hypothetical protein WG66_014864 [Moniliophthora roreri]|nr:hypothetical protein WG66_014864 [Moniliophthora roreri]